VSFQTDRNSARRQEPQINILLYGVGVILITAVVTLSLCLLAGQLRLRVKRRLDKRRRFDKSGEYERVDSVSSIVDSSYSQTDVYIDGTTDDVTVI